jgi:hypothetical protein
VVAEARSEVIASFWQMAISEKPPEGWRVAWNPDGPLEQVAKYSDLTAVNSKKPGERRVMQRGALDGNGALRDDAPNLSSNGVAQVPKSPANGTKRYLIASYTMPRDSLGSVWINDGNIQNKNVAAGVELKIFLNGTLLKDLTAAMAPVPTLFQQALGPLKKGDTVSVAVGPAKSEKGAVGGIRYILEEWPDGKSPAPPQNTFHLPIDAYGPQYDSDGTCAAYEAKQAAFNETLLARKPELVFLGDSITSRWPQELLEKHFGAYRPVNLGVGGDRVQNVIWRLQRTPLEATPLKALVLLIGTNNAGAFTSEEIAGGIQKLVKMVEELTAVIKNELAVTEPTLTVTVDMVKTPKKIIDKKTQKNLTAAIVACPNAVIRMSDSMEGLVETSTNLAIVKSNAKKKTITASFLMRSSVDSAKEELGSRTKAVFELAGAEVKFSGAYPGWKPNMDSAILKTMQDVYNKNFGKIPEIKAIHAGLECGILGGNYPHWDMISFGPTIRFPHSPDEKVNIATVQKFWDFLVETLKNIPVK